MAAAERSLSIILDDIALKIMMVEPGDLSTIGELLELADECINSDESQKQPVSVEMAQSFKSVFEQLIMGEVSDSSESYDHLGQCVSLMQEMERSGCEDETITGRFCDHLRQTGYKIDNVKFPALVADQGAAPKDEEPDTRFLQDRELLHGFIDESVEHLESIENLILELEKNPDDPEIINAVFRAFHTIKGTSALVDLDTINQLAHKTENLLDAVRNGRRKMDSGVADMVLRVSDLLLTMIQNVKDVAEKGLEHYQCFGISELIEQIDLVESCEAGTEGGEEEASPSGMSLGEGEVPDFMQDPELLSGFISEAYEHLESIEVHVLELEQDPDNLDIINNIFRPFHTIKGVSGFLNLKTINTLAHTTENLLDDVRN
ncbi:MAG: Hpt domain-containing protein, partial [Desulfobulbaceae bacterium]|nr:Hpt domain-containing protein [Desulfobulbaceae bacterium]